MKPDISLATKSGHFNLLPTDKNIAVLCEKWRYPGLHRNSPHREARLPRTGDRLRPPKAYAGREMSHEVRPKPSYQSGVWPR